MFSDVFLDKVSKYTQYINNNLDVLCNFVLFRYIYILIFIIHDDGTFKLL